MTHQWLATSTANITTHGASASNDLFIDARCYGLRSIGGDPAARARSGSADPGAIVLPIPMPPGL